MLKELVEERTASLEGDNASFIIDEVIKLLNSGDIRVAEKVNGSWIVNSWIKQALLIGFKCRRAEKQEFGGFDKFGILDFDYNNPRYRKVPGAIIRDGTYIGDDAIIMPSFINIGAYVGERSMIDIHAAIGSCAQIGKNCHISALACIGGVLEPPSAKPVIIEDNCFIGAHSSILEGVIVGENSVIASGVTISSSTKIIDRMTGNNYIREVPKNSVIVSGSYRSNDLNISCAIIVKTVDFNTRQKSSINEILRM
ncbi:MAG: 2,3,4,5-tetrahydropyridine-2,6-dicarboxylate N-succinyltransferase [Holosporales bacterium]|jgi:2,3,4,5-tetrahydropyridine-2-carboxylate N-succinyltransferase|nr:2,3,4,5-tetrahydropyridine-2,6-dicarboxylate N-succinyltransferase [Holosporales bacterium]